MNKYIVRATAQLLAFSLLTMLGSFLILRTLEYFQPSFETMIGVIVSIVGAYTFYNLIQIQASILESRDRLKNRE